MLTKKKQIVQIFIFKSENFFRTAKYFGNFPLPWMNSHIWSRFDTSPKKIEQHRVRPILTKSVFFLKKELRWTESFDQFFSWQSKILEQQHKCFVFKALGKRVIFILSNSCFFLVYQKLIELRLDIAKKNRNCIGVSFCGKNCRWLKRNKSLTTITSQSRILVFYNNFIQSVSVRKSG